VSTCNTGGALGVTGLVVFGEVDGTNYLGVCEYSSSGGGTWTLTTIPACDELDLSSAYVDLYDDGPTGANTTIAPVVNSGGLTCGSTLLLPFADYFVFGLGFRGGSGTDHVYGTPNTDYLRSNLNALTTTPADNNGNYEVLCGYEGNDELISDAAATLTVGVCLNGGPGVGVAAKSECTVNSTMRLDAVYDCDTVTNNPGISDDCYDCDCGDAPDDSFFPQP
jgi:hypothetical protein